MTDGGDDAEEDEDMVIDSIETVAAGEKNTADNAKENVNIAIDIRAPVTNEVSKEVPDPMTLHKQSSDVLEKKEETCQPAPMEADTSVSNAE